VLSHNHQTTTGTSSGCEIPAARRCAANEGTPFLSPGSPGRDLLPY
jgi:hypothetical protein